MSERMSSLGGEVYHAYEREPDPLRYPGHKMGERAQELGSAIRLYFRDAVHTALRDPSYTDAFRERVQAEELDLPPVEVCDTPESVRRHLADFGYTRSAEKAFDDEALLILRLPDPMNRPYQWKAVPDPDQEQWMRLYRQTLDAVYAAAEDAFRDKDAEIHRLNPVGVHGSDQHTGYYYLWLIAPKGRDRMGMEYPDDYVEPERKSYAEDEDMEDEDEVPASEAA